MFEQTGKRPVVYNNKCGQMCGVSIKLHLSCFINYIHYYFSVVQKRFVLFK